MPLCNVQATATAVYTSANRNGTVFLENKSDTDILFAVGDENVAELSATVGIKLEPGESAQVSGLSASHAISAIHGSTGGKNLYYSLV